MYSSNVSLNRYTPRLKPSHGSRGSRSPSTVAQPDTSSRHSSAVLTWLSSPCLLLLGLPLGGLVEQELANQILEHHRRLREAQPVAVLEHHAVAAGLEPDVLLAEDSRSEDLGGGVARKLVAGIDRQRHHRLIGLIVEADVGDPPHDHARALDGAA